MHKDKDLAASYIGHESQRITATQRAQAKLQKPLVIWLTGISGAGKTTLGSLLDNWLHAQGFHTYLLDGDQVRKGLTRDLGFSDADRSENVRRIAETAKLMVDAGVIVIVALISPFRADRQLARSLLPPGMFIEVFIDTPIETAEQRDVKGLYHGARTGKVAQFTAIHSPYEPPILPEITIKTDGATPTECLHQILGKLPFEEMKVKNFFA